MSKVMSSTNSPCAACKFLRRKCMQGCIFAPYFPPDNPAKFAQVHRVFGASNVAKLLNDLTPAQREDAVNSLAYEAEARLHDPVHGCVGYISLLQHRLLQLQRDLSAAKKELSTYIGRAAFGPFMPHNQFYATAMAMPAGMGLGIGGQESAWTSTETPMYRDQQHHHQMVEAHQLAEAVAAAREHEMLRSMEQQHEMLRLMGDGNSAGLSAMMAAEDSPRLALISPHIGGFEGSFSLLQQQEGRQFQEEFGHHLHNFHHQKRSLDEGRSGVGPSS